MKKTNLIPALAIAMMAATSLWLPTTASADSFTYKEKAVVRGNHARGGHLIPVHDIGRRYRDSHTYGTSRWLPSHRNLDRGRRYGQQYRYVPRIEYRPMVRLGPRHDYRPVERYKLSNDDNIRVRVSYDLHL